MNTAHEIKLPAGHLDTVGWLAFSGAFTANALIDKLRDTMEQRDSLQERYQKTCAALDAETQTREHFQSKARDLESANRKNARVILKKKKR